jgi:hypothetical protein
MKHRATPETNAMPPLAQPSNNRFLLLDSGPLGLLTHPQRTAEVLGIIDWASRCMRGGTRIMVPAIVYYEVVED